jgi:biotin synthase
MKDLRDLGFKIGTGSMVGLPGQSPEQVADDILFAKRLGVQMVSASPFVPAPNTPLEKDKPGSVLLTLRAIAVTRILMPYLLIPSVSALEANQSGAQGAGLKAGANVLTANFTPTDRKKDYLIYGVNRYISELQHVQDLLKTNGLCKSNSQWIQR